MRSSAPVPPAAALARRNGQRPAGRGEARQASPRARQRSRRREIGLAESQIGNAWRVQRPFHGGSGRRRDGHVVERDRQRRAGPVPIAAATERSRSVAASRPVDARHRGPAVAAGHDRPARGQLAPMRRRQPVRLLASSTYERCVALLGARRRTRSGRTGRRCPQAGEPALPDAHPCGGEGALGGAREKAPDIPGGSLCRVSRTGRRTPRGAPGRLPRRD
jgi:hypothetical protein